MRAVNLLPPDLRSGPKGPAPAVASGEKTSGAGAFIVLGVLAFAVLALAAYVLAGNTVKDRQAELARANAESAQVTQRVTALKPYADFEALAQARVQTVTDLANSRFDWEQALRDLARAVPADVTVASFKGDLGGDTTGGAGGIRGAITAPAITLAGCTYSQTKVATLMARLRTIDGVTRVSLSKSDKEATVGSLGGDRTAPSATGYCGKTDVPAFEMVVFFEGAKAASTAPSPGTTTATTTTTSTPAAGTTPAPAAGTTTGTPAATPAASSTPAATPAGAATTTPASSTTTP